MSSELYLCHNPACSLGSMKQPGRFVGGITKEQAHLLSGTPLESLEKGVTYGDGVCPNCGQFSGVEYDSAAAVKEALAEAKAAYDAHVEAIKEGVS
jgi:hypothetical protein